MNPGLTKTEELAPTQLVNKENSNFVPGSSSDSSVSGSMGHGTSVPLSFDPHTIGKVVDFLSKYLKNPKSNTDVHGLKTVESYLTQGLQLIITCLLQASPAFAYPELLKYVKNVDVPNIGELDPKFHGKFIKFAVKLLTRANIKTDPLTSVLSIKDLKPLEAFLNATKNPYVKEVCLILNINKKGAPPSKKKPQTEATVQTANSSGPKDPTQLENTKVDGPSVVNTVNQAKTETVISKPLSTVGESGPSDFSTLAHDPTKGMGELIDLKESKEEPHKPSHAKDNTLAPKEPSSAIVSDAESNNNANPKVSQKELLDALTKLNKVVIDTMKNIKTPIDDGRVTLTKDSRKSFLKLLEFLNKSTDEEKKSEKSEKSKSEIAQALENASKRLQKAICGLVEKGEEATKLNKTIAQLEQKAKDLESSSSEKQVQAQEEMKQGVQNLIKFFENLNGDFENLKGETLKLHKGKAFGSLKISKQKNLTKAQDIDFKPPNNAPLKGSSHVLKSDEE